MFEAQTQIRVRYAETDQMGYVYYGNYATYFEVGRVETLRQMGLSYKELEDQGLYVTSVLNRFGVKAFKNIQAEQRKRDKDNIVLGSRKKSIEESLAELSVSSSSSDEGSSISSSADSLPSAVVSFKHVRKATTEKKIDFLLERPVVRTTSEKKEETTMKMGLPRDCSKYLFRFCFVKLQFTLIE